MVHVTAEAGELDRPTIPALAIAAAMTVVINLRICKDFSRLMWILSAKNKVAGPRS